MSTRRVQAAAQDGMLVKNQVVYTLCNGRVVCFSVLVRLGRGRHRTTSVPRGSRRENIKTAGNMVSTWCLYGVSSEQAVEAGRRRDYPGTARPLPPSPAPTHFVISQIGKSTPLISLCNSISLLRSRHPLPPRKATLVPPPPAPAPTQAPHLW
jgi:hypothetical protein